MKLLKKILSEKYKRSIKERLGVPTLHWSLSNLKRNNFNPAVVIDVGAYEGNWTLELLEVYPSSKVLMVEAQKNKEPMLRSITAANANVAYDIALLSSLSGVEKWFQEDETASQVINVNNACGAAYPIQSKTLDELLAQRQFPYPDLLKLDVQGHELEVLHGAANSLNHAEICLLEVSLMDFGGNIPLLPEMLNFMESKNFQAYDISQFMRRPLDRSLYQLDMFFVKKTSALIKDKRWA